MSDLTELLPEHFFRLAIERGGLDLEEVIRDLGPEAAAALRCIAATPAPDSMAKDALPPRTRSADLPPATRSAEPSPQTRSAVAPEPDESSDEPMSELTRWAMSGSLPSAPGGAPPPSPTREVETKRDARPVRHRCPACGRPALENDRFCRGCGWDLAQPAPAITLDEMVEEDQITAEQADELRQRLLDLQQNYPAGARYSVFGGPS